MATFFTSDLHLGHARICELAGRPFSGVEEMNSTIITRWNERVSAKDTAFVLGDAVMGKFKETLELVKQLNGREIFLIPGNHDRIHPAYEIKDAKRQEALSMYVDAGFTILPLEYAYEGAFRLCHFPYEGDSQDVERYSEYRPKFDPVFPWLVHGHVHEKWKVNGNQINVGVDVWDFYPVPEEEIYEIIRNG